MPRLSALPYDLSIGAGFVRAIGLDVTIRRGADGVLPRVCIERGALFIDERCSIGDLLHEAGHLAVTPQPWRSLCSGNVEGAHQAMFQDLRSAGAHPDSPIFRAALQAGEVEAIAWAWAAGIHLGVDPERIIENGAYGGEEDGLRAALALGATPGVHGLAHAGFCSVRPSRLNPLPAFPVLRFWLQPASLPSIS